MSCLTSLALREAEERVTKVRKVSPPCLHGYAPPSKKKKKEEEAKDQCQNELLWLVVIFSYCYI